MNTQIHVLPNDMGTLAEDAPADVDEGKVVEGVVFRGDRKIPARVREKVVEGLRAADNCVREHPYEMIGLAVGLGALMGCLLARACCAPRIRSG